MNPREIKTLEKHLGRFFKQDKTARARFEELVKDEQMSAADIYRIIANGLGHPCTHWSGKTEDEVKDS